MDTGGTSTLYVSINNNDSGTSLTNLAISNTLPSGLTGSNPITTCGGTASYNSGTRVFSLTGGSVGPLSNCGLSITVTTNTQGNYNFTSGSYTSTQASTGGASATLDVYPPPTATQAIASKTLTQNQPSTSFTPVTGANGVPSLSYSISPTLPSGLSIDSSSGQISGSPNTSLAATTFTVTVSDATSVTANNTFSLTVNSAVTATQAVASKTLLVNQSFTAFAPVTGGGGTSPLSYSISPALSAGLTFSASTGQIGGTPTAAKSSTTYTVTVSDANSATASNTFQMTVNAAVAPTIAAAFSPTSISTASGSTATLTLTITNSNSGTQLTGVAVAGAALPANLTGSSPATTCAGATATYVGGTRVLSLSGGSLNASSNCTLTLTVSSNVPGTYSYTSGAVSATGPASLTGSSATAATPLSVIGPTASLAISTVTLTQGHAATSFTPVTASGGAAPLTYSISPTLPTGLSITPATGAITGTPAVVSASTTYTVTVTDANTATDSKSFSLTVNAAVTATQAVANATATQGHAVTSFTPVAGGGGTAPLTYAISPGLPTGLSFNTSNGQITGAATVTSFPTTYTVTVSDANSATASSTFVLAVNSAVTATQSIPTETLTQNSAAVNFTPVTGGGGTVPLSYGISPGLPAGLSIDSGSGAITGTPTAAQAASTFTVTVTDANGANASNTFTLIVNGAVTATLAVSAASLTQNHAITAFTPVTGGGGTSPLAYAVSPALPTGLSFSTSSGQISGTPTAISATTTYTVTVTDANSVSATNTFALTVNGSVTATQAVPTTSLGVNTAATPFTPVTGAGGTVPLAYDVGPSLPTGLTFNTSTGEVTGRPTALSSATTYTVTVTDANSATASNTFSLAVIKLTATVTLTSSNPSPQPNQPVTLTATLNPTVASGTITFTDGATTLCDQVPVTSGVATCTTSFATPGSHSLAANYNGDGTYDVAQIAKALLVQNNAVEKSAAIGGFISDRGNLIVSNLFDMNRDIDRLNDAQGNGNPSSSGFSDQPKSSPAPAAMGFGAVRQMESGIVIPAAGVAGSGGSMSDFYGLQALLHSAMENAGQDGAIDRFTYSGPFDATVNAHDGFAASFHTSLSQMMRWQDAALGINNSGHGHSFNPLDVWMEGTYAGYDGERSGQFGLFSIGTDYVLNPNLLIGVFTQVDTMTQTSGKGLNGLGWMAGPYATMRLQQNLFWNARAAFGTSNNTLAGTDNFTSTRWLASTSLSGRWNLSKQMTLTPDLSFTYFTDTTAAYKDSFGVTIPGVKTELGQLKFSPTLAYGFATDGGAWIEPSITPELIWNFASTNVDGLGTLSETATGPTGLRVRVKAGMNIRTPSGVSIGAFGSYDGIGSANYSSIATQAQVTVPLH